jgi:predicted RNA-binding protein YlqC (UPF0109 family)
MNTEFIKFILSSIIKDINNVTISCASEENRCDIKVVVALEDMKKIIQYRGKLYRAIKMIFKHYFKKEVIGLTIDVQGDK